jgi:hypothetical protein
VYAENLALHSFVRWLVVALGLVVITRSARALCQGAPFTRTDERLAAAFMAAANTQFLLGVLLWFVTSPLPRVGLTHGLWRTPSLAFFVVAHPSAMVLALGVLHAGRGRLKRLPADVSRHRSWLKTVASAMLVVLIAIPWPALWPFGRPLWRGIS